MMFSFQTYFLPVIGLIDAEKLKPADLVVSNSFPIFNFISDFLYYVYNHI